MPTDETAGPLTKPQVRSFHDELRPFVKRAHWAGQRAVWALLAAVIVASITGLFGGGVLAGASDEESVGGLSAELSYDRFGRRESEQELRLTVSMAEPAESISIALDRQFLEDVRVEAIEPDPDSVSMAQDGPSYAWETEGEATDFAITIVYVPHHWRRITGDLTVRAGASTASLSFRQFVFP
jgi:hypothetical protein